jgi:hypothetical protein
LIVAIIGQSNVSALCAQTNATTPGGAGNLASWKNTGPKASPQSANQNGKPQSASPLVEIIALMDKGSFRLARQKLEEYIAGNPDDVEARLVAGRLYRQMGLTSLSIVSYEEARRRAPQILEPYIALSQMQLENLNVEIALSMGREAVKLAPTSKEARFALISALISNYSLIEAKRELDQLLNDASEDPEVYYLGFKLYQDSGELAKAREYLDAALRRRPDKISWLFDLSELCQAQGKYLEARDAMLTYLKSMPDSTRAQTKLAEILEHGLYDYDGAQRVYEAILKDDPENPTALAGQLRLAKKQNDLAAAIKRAFWDLIAWMTGTKQP